ncbi:mCG146883 [Mus musculus]|nr:mCG146883 [Mus musculus]
MWRRKDLKAACMQFGQVLPQHVGSVSAEITVPIGQSLLKQEETAAYHQKFLANGQTSCGASAQWITTWQ